MGELVHRDVAMNTDGQRVCLLTGASGRSGDMFCRLYGHRYAIVAVYRTQAVAPPAPLCWHIDPADPSIREPMRNPGFAVIQADLTAARDIDRIVDFALDTFGHVDLLINAAASMQCAPLLSTELSFKDVARTMEVKVLALMRLAVELARRFWISRAAENAAMK